MEKGDVGLVLLEGWFCETEVVLELFSVDL
jgi:hypothetical protein